MFYKGPEKTIAETVQEEDEVKREIGKDFTAWEAKYSKIEAARIWQIRITLY